ncbi:MAG TPA: DUF397 domain-containing protein [Pseudonocardiaceae bacterium]
MIIDSDTAAVRWTTSSFCDAEGCVAIARLADGQIAVADSKDSNGSELIFTAAEWAAFVAGVRAGEFDFQ